MSSVLSSVWHTIKLIETFGQDVTIYRYSISVDENGNIENETCYDTISTKAWVFHFGGYMEAYDLYGYRVQGDFAICVPGTVEVDTADKVKLVDGTVCRVREIVKHYDLNDVAYIEIVGQKEST